MKAVVLAAGVGSRLDPLTNQIPKPLVPVVNCPVMEHTLSLLKEHGITEIVSNLHHLPDKLIEYFQDGSPCGVKLQFHLEKQLTGDAGGVRALRPYLDNETVLVMMGDLLTDADLSSIISAHKRKGALATIATKEVSDVSHFGVVVSNENGFITAFQEKPQPHEALSNFASTGIYVLEPEVFKYIPEHGSFGFGRQLFPSLVKLGAPILGYAIDSYWSDVGTIDKYRQSNFDALNGNLKIKLPGKKTSFGYQGSNSEIAPNCIIDGMLVLGENSYISDGVKIKGQVIIGNNCVIGNNVELQNTIVWSKTSIESHSKLNNAIVSNNYLVNNPFPERQSSLVKP